MEVLIVFAAFLVAVYAQGPIQYAPIPYSFNYLAQGDEGSSGHQESGDGAGNVQGSYTVTDLDGRSRVVEYVADAGGFRAVVKTNEPGTDNSAPANVIVESSSPDAKGPIIRYSNEAAPTPVRPAVRRQPQGVRYVLVPANSPMSPWVGGY
nr:cuticle protein 10.9 isoform X2 [Parasteatoda tepidariorum]